jgi:hypothetical protein
MSHFWQIDHDCPLIDAAGRITSRKSAPLSKRSEGRWRRKERMLAGTPAKVSQGSEPSRSVDKIAAPSLAFRAARGPARDGD